MRLDITLKHINHSEEIKSFINDKTQKLTHYFHGKIHAVWTISYERDTHISHLHVLGNSIDYYSNHEDHNILTSIEHAVSKLEKQLKKKKEQRISRSA